MYHLVSTSRAACRSSAWLMAAFIGFAATTLPMAAAPILFTGPQDGNGITCDPSGPHCIIGDRPTFQIFSASIAQPTTPGGSFELVLQTNYGVPLPGANEVIPAFAYGQGMFAMCDFMIEWNNKFYGIVLHAHDDYTPGYLYEVTGFQTSGALLAAQGETSVRPDMPALINAGGTQIATGILTAAANAGADGLTQARYRITVDFQAPSDFLASGDFTIHACSFVCDNGVITGTGHFPPPMTPTPEPGTWVMVVVGLGGACWKRRR